MKLSGNCLCGKVEFSILTDQKHFDSCHCSMCRRWCGGPALTVEAKEGVNFKDQNYVKLYNSSRWAERGFCSHCGTHLFYRLKEGDFWNVPPGVLNDQSDFKFTKQIYVDYKPSYYSFSNETNMMTEADVLKEFGASN